jgi:5-methylcytosine-specific restriction endonuclease McrA
MAAATEVQGALAALDARSWEEYLADLRRQDASHLPADDVLVTLPDCPYSEQRVLREQWLRDDAGYPLGGGMPTGRVLRADGQSHRDWWMSVLRADPCSYCGREAGSRLLEDGRTLPGGTLDHIDPHSGRTRGGVGNWDWPNFAGACAACNHSKGNESLLRFLERRVPGRKPAPRPVREHALIPSPVGLPGRRRGSAPMVRRRRGIGRRRGRRVAYTLVP